MTAVVQPMQCQVEASRFATRADDAEARAARIRANGHAKAIRHLVAGRRGQAFAEVMATYFEQVRALGLHLHQTERGTW